MKINKPITKFAALAAATLGLSLGTVSANAAFITGSISFADGFSGPEQLVSTAAFFDINSSNTSVVATTGDFVAIIPPAPVDTAGDINTAGAGGLLYDVGGFTFDWDNIFNDMNTALTCNMFGQCTDTRTLDMSGTVSAAGFDDSLLVANWTANGACEEDQSAPGTCLAGTYSSSWSSSLVALGAPPVMMPSPGPLALISIGLLGLAYQSRRKA